MSAGLWSVQAAIYAALTGVGIASGRIYDDVPQNPTFPYVTIGESQSLAADITCRDGEEEYVDLHIWSQYSGQKELKDIAAAIHAALHGVSLSAAGRSSAHAFIQSVRTMRDPDGVTRHGVVTVRVDHFE